MKPEEKAIIDEIKELAKDFWDLQKGLSEHIRGYENTPIARDYQDSFVRYGEHIRNEISILKQKLSELQSV